MQGQIIGTPAYMAPEQAEGRTELHGPVTDNYALGGILYKILTGQSPEAPASSAPAAAASASSPSSPRRRPPRWARMSIPSSIVSAPAPWPPTPPPATRALEMAQEIQRWLDEHPLSFKVATLKDKVSDILRPVLIPLLVVLVGIIAVLATMLVMRRGK